MTEQEQNKKINELSRRVERLERVIKTHELDLEPEGRLSEAFEQIERHLTEQDKKIERLERGQNRIEASLDHIIDRLTGFTDLPEE